MSAFLCKNFRGRRRNIRCRHCCSCR